MLTFNLVFLVFYVFRQVSESVCQNFRQSRAKFHDWWPVLILYSFIDWTRREKQKQSTIHLLFYQERWVFISYLHVNGNTSYGKGSWQRK